MKGTCCICLKKINQGKSATGKLLASFTPSHFTLCAHCLGQTKADIARIYGVPTTGGAGLEKNGGREVRP